MKINHPKFSSEVFRQGPRIRKGYLQEIVRSTARERGGVLKILEVGSWTGASAIALALALDEIGARGHVHCVDAWKPYFNTEIDSAPIYKTMNLLAAENKALRDFQENIQIAGISNRIIYTVGNSTDVLPIINSESYDIIFIDASHQFEDVNFDIGQGKRILKNKGIICGDDLEVAPFEIAEQELLDDVASGRDYVTDMKTGINYHPGVTLAVKRHFTEVGVANGLWAVKKNENSWSKYPLEDFNPKIPDFLTTETGETRLLESIQKFNILKCQGLYIACRQSLGAIDFSAPIEFISTQYKKEDFSIFQELQEARDFAKTEIYHPTSNNNKWWNISFKK